MKPIVRARIFFAAGIVAGITLVALFAFKENGILTSRTHKSAQQQGVMWTPPAIPQQMDFAGEKVPLERWDIKERFEREYLYNYYSPGPIIYVIKLSHRYFPMIEETLKKNGVPEDFKYLCIAESNLQNATSSAGAVGFWQFMKGTASGYMEVNDNVDERYYVQKATDAACSYLKTAYQRFGSWTAAAASYNCGMGGYGKQATAQRTNNFYDLVLPEETSKYIFRIVAFKNLIGNEGSNGFDVPDDEVYKPIELEL
jgi:membrane-bound lytic murein transglycosylase D